MEPENAQAAGEGGTVTVLAPLSQDEIHRQTALERLADTFTRVDALLARCEALSRADRGDRLGPIYAAARIVDANAHLAKAFAHVALIETRHRTIVERSQPPDPKNAGLNSGLSSGDDARVELERRLDHLFAVRTKEQEALHDAAIGCCI